MLKVKNLSAGYGGDMVVKDVSLSLRLGESLSVLGPNGCGKTTLLRAIARLIDFSGEVTLEGKSTRDMTRRDMAREVAVMSQVSSVYFGYSVYDTVMLGRYQHIAGGIFRALSQADRAVVKECLGATGLWDIRQSPINRLSGGQLQRVFLAKALAQQPRVILLDEPTNHLDMKNQVELIEYLKAWVKTGEHAVIGVFHDVNLALNLSGKMVFMKDGQIAGQGTFPEVAKREFLEDVYGMDVVGYMKNTLSLWQSAAG